jgi:HEAT repeat protein
MSTRLSFVLCLIPLLLAGCSRSGPPLAGGKPIEHWLSALSDADPAVRKTAAFKLGNVGPAAPGVLPALRTALADADPRVRCEAIVALLKCGDAARESTPALEDLQQRDPDATVRDYATKALEKLRQTPG